MSTTKEKLQAALKEAMVSKNNHRRDVVRFVQSAIKQVEIDTRKEVTEEEAQAIVQKQAKSRRESIAEAQKLGRQDIADSEQAELVVIEEFLPKQLSREELTTIIQATISEVGATSAKEVGKVMGVLQPKVKGLADGALVSQIVRDILK
jgi:uncharacterized protein